MSRWVIHAQASFDAHHALTSYRGERETPHRHSWKVEVRIGTDALNDEGFALDFHQTHAVLQTAIAPLDSSDLNAHPDIGPPSPTAERLAEFLAAILAPGYEALGGRLLSVSVWEGPENRVDLNLEIHER